MINHQPVCFSCASFVLNAFDRFVGSSFRGLISGCLTQTIHCFFFLEAVGRTWLETSASFDQWKPLLWREGLQCSEMLTDNLSPLNIFSRSSHSEVYYHVHFVFTNTNSSVSLLEKHLCSLLLTKEHSLTRRRQLQVSSIDILTHTHTHAALGSFFLKCHRAVAEFCICLTRTSWTIKPVCSFPVWQGSANIVIQHERLLCVICVCVREIEIRRGEQERETGKEKESERVNMVLIYSTGHLSMSYTHMHTLACIPLVSRPIHHMWSCCTRVQTHTPTGPH